MDFVIYPAIDLREGRVVRLFQGDYARQTPYAFEPLALAAEWRDAGADWLHVVDLDGARHGRLHTLDLLHKLAATGLKLQAGGGVRGFADVERLLAVGVSRVVVGSMAVREPERVFDWLHRLGPEHLTIALDARWRDGAWRLSSNGWTENEDVLLDELAPRYAAAGARQLLCTDIDRDGTLTGSNLDLLAHLRVLVPSMAVQVSGGVQSVEEITAARAGGAAGVVLGRSLLEGRFSLAQAVAAVAEGMPC